MKRLFLFIVLTVGICANAVFAQDYKYKYSADKGDGTYVNPIVNGDFPDCDVIRVDSMFYFVSTTMYHFPGATLLKSRDLVNWEYCANPLLQIDDNDAYNLLNGGSHYAQGMWASSLNYHDRKFYIYFISYGRNGYDGGRNVLLTATDPEGVWKMEYMNEHYYDAGWLFDDGENGDGFLYVACGIGNIHINKLNPKTLKKISSTSSPVVSADSYEGSHMYHIGDYYYLYVTTGGYWKGQTIYRSKKPMGPYEEVPYKLFQGDAIHQGALVDTPTGEWWTILFKDAGAIGRVPYLEPVTWKDGWPQVGKYGTSEKRWMDVSKNGARYKKPKISDDEAVNAYLNSAENRTYMPTNDAFASDKLGMQWAWNHNPQKDAWSLTERPGWMRLYSCTVTDDLMKARGSLTQRIMGYSPEGTASSAWKSSFGTVKLDLSNMQDGDIAGLAVVQNPYSFIGVKMEDGKKYLYSIRSSFASQKTAIQEQKKGAEVKEDVIYLRAVVNFGTNSCNYLYTYSLDKSFTKWGVTMNMGYTLDHFVGQRFYIFNYSTKATGGYVDVDWFTTEQTVPVDYFAEQDANQVIDAPMEEVEEWTGFPFTKEEFNPSIVGTGTFSPASKVLKTSANGMGGWKYPKPWDISAHKYLVMNFATAIKAKAELRIYDKSNVWTEPYSVDIYKQRSVTVDLQNMVTASGRKIDPSKVSMVAFSSDGSQYIYIKEVFLSDDGTTPTNVERVEADDAQLPVYNLTGRRVSKAGKGVYIQKNKKYIK